jgi:hypothetical protein
VPDEVDRWTPASVRTPRAVDLLDDLAAFVATFPAWCGPDGLPRSWRHYVYGCRYLSRVHLRSQLAAAESARMSQAVKEDYVSWATDVRQQLEVPRG